MKASALAVLLALLPACALAGDGNQLVKGAPVALKADTAYLLLRTSAAKDNFPVDVVFVRVLGAEELQAAVERHKADPDAKEEPNVASVWFRDPYAEIDGRDIYLMSVKPGTYILAGPAFGAPHGFLYDDKFVGRMAACMCMGTVKFDARPGVVTDLGMILSVRADKPIAVPELAGYERNIDSSEMYLAMTVRPESADMPLPDALKPLPRADADYRAMGPFPNYFGSAIDRLAPVPGVLDYDKDGHVVDLKAAAPAR